MSETKSHQFRPPLYHQNSNRRSNAQSTGADPRSEQKGWDAYRKWLSSVNGKPKAERTPIDHSIYSWKGYQTWADRVKQDWKDKDQDKD